MPSILFVTTIDATQGFLLPFAAHLRALGWRVDALANGSSTNDQLRESFDQCFEADWTRNPLSRGTLTSPGRVREIVHDGRYDIVWVHTPVAAFMTRFALRNCKRNPSIVYTAHGFHFHSKGREPANTIYRALEHEAARWCDYLVTINAEDYRAACEFGTIAPHRIRLIHGIGVDTNVYDHDALAEAVVSGIRDDLGVASQAIMVTLVGEFTPNKRHRLALEALLLVADTRVMLILVGSGPLEESIRVLAAEMGLGERVRMTGYRHDVAELLAASDMLLVCSRREGLIRSGLEAMSLGIPIVCTPTRGAADLVADDKYGWVSPSDDPVDIARTIDAAAALPAERGHRGMLARRRAQEEYSLERIVHAYECLFSEALKERT